MARKTAADLGRIDPAIEEFVEITSYKAEIAVATFDAQDKETQKLILKIADVLKQYATGTIQVGRRSIDITADVLKENCLYLAVEIVKDLAMLDIRVGNFVFPQGACVKCGGDVG